MTRSVILSILCVVLAAGSLYAVEAPTAELGKTLFTSPDLGGNAKSCSTCHPDGRGLEEIGFYSDDQLREMINFCIRDALKGEMLDPDSRELESLFLYVKSLAPEK